MSRLIRSSIILILAITFGALIFPHEVKASSFSVEFIDVGKGDSALVECDGKYMLIDGGLEEAGDKVYNVLKEHNVDRLDFLVISHLHADHIMGLDKALTYPSKIIRTLGNTEKGQDQYYLQLKSRLDECGTTIRVPKPGFKYKLGSAEVVVLDNLYKNKNDSLVILIKYGNTSFLFTGDIEKKAQNKILDEYEDTDENVTVIKLPHHGAYTKPLRRFFEKYHPEYAIISLGDGEALGLPDQKLLDLLSENQQTTLYRTDIDGDIILESDGNNVWRVN